MESKGLDGSTGTEGEISPATEENMMGNSNFTNNMNNGTNNQPQLMNEQELQDFLDDLVDTHGLETEDRNEIEQSLREEGHGAQESSQEPSQQTNNGQNVVFNNANVQMNQAQLTGTNSLNTMNAGEIDVTADEQNTEAGNVESEKTGGNEKVGVNSRQLLGQSLLDRVRGLGVSILEKPRVQEVLEKPKVQEAIQKGKEGIQKGKEGLEALKTPEALTGLQNIRSAMHELTDSFYADAPSGDWKANQEYITQAIDNRKQQNLINFVNDPKNISKAKEVFNLHDKKDSNGNIITAEEQAKEKLKGMEPYVSRGITDIDKIAAMQSTGQAPERAIKMYLNASKEAAKVQNFVTNENNIQSMRNIVADRLNIPADTKDPQLIQQINQEVRQEFKEGAKYIASGAAKDSETLDRLVQLERKIDERVNLTPAPGTTKQDSILKADKIVEKALKDKAKDIKIPGADSKPGVKQLQEALNKELKERQAKDSKKDNK